MVDTSALFFLAAHAFTLTQTGDVVPRLGEPRYKTLLLRCRAGVLRHASKYCPTEQGAQRRSIAQICTTGSSVIYSQKLRATRVAHARAQRTSFNLMRGKSQVVMDSTLRASASSGVISGHESSPAESAPLATVSMPRLAMFASSLSGGVAWPMSNSSTPSNSGRRPGPFGGNGGVSGAAAGTLGGPAESLVATGISLPDSVATTAARDVGPS